jgi:hypothetical protein
MFPLRNIDKGYLWEWEKEYFLRGRKKLS